MKKAQGKIIVISGPTGSGESTITRRVLEFFSTMERIITATSRSPRPTEKDGVDYYFLSLVEFRDHIAAGDFLEYIEVPSRGVYYGTLKKPIEEKRNAGIHLVGNLGWPGHSSFSRAYPGSVLSIFIKPESLSVIRDRIIKRDPTITSEEVEQRVQHAAREMQDAEHYDYVVVNKEGKMEDAVEEVRGMVESFLEKGQA